MEVRKIQMPQQSFSLGDALSNDLYDKMMAMAQENDQSAEATTDEIVDGKAASPEEDATMRSSRRTTATTVVSIVAYLIGVPESYFGKEYQRTIFDELAQKDEAKTLRALCTIRNGLMKNIGHLVIELRNSLHRIENMPALIDSEAFAYLESQRIYVSRGKRDAIEYLIQVNGEIANQVNKCRVLIPMWVKWEYLRSMFVMPKGTKRNEIQNTIYRFNDNRNSYPFQCFINWPIDHPEAYVLDPGNHAEPVTTGNVLQNDKKFLVLLYRIRHDEFVDFDRVTDASLETKNSLSEFMQKAGDIVVLVDCENSDPYKLCALLQHLKETGLRMHSDFSYGTMADDIAESTFKKIKKILLFDDVHTVDAWDVLGQYTEIPLVHEEVERIVGHKSLIDIAVTVGACRECFCNGVNSFLLASSDSDFWGLMRTMPDVNFMVLAEKTKFGENTRAAYDEHSISYCLMDDFAANVRDIKRGALMTGMVQYMNQRMQFNLSDMLDELYDSLRLDMTTREKEMFREQIVPKVRLSFDADGTPRASVEK